MSDLKNPLAVSLAGLDFASPLLNASGTFNPEAFGRLFPLKSALGGIVTKTVTANPTVGNPQRRTVELPGIGMLNSIGLQNPGLDYFLTQERHALKAHGLPLILSISACSNREFAAMAERVAEEAPEVDALEVNLSCPNVEKGGAHFGSDPELVEAAILAVTQGFPKPVFAKLTPNVTDIRTLGEAALKGGATGLTAINTVMGAAIDIRRRQPHLPRVSGGYSGPGIKPIAIHALWQLRQAFPQTPLIGVGGLACADDVVEFLMAGANLVQVGTLCFRYPTVFQQIVQGLTAYLAEEGLGSIADLTNAAHPAPPAFVTMKP